MKKPGWLTKIFLATMTLGILGFTYLAYIEVQAARENIFAKSLMGIKGPEDLDALKKRIAREPEFVNRKFFMTDEDISLAHLVCWSSNLEAIEYLKALDADFSQETLNSGDTPLTILTKKGSANAPECIRAVLASKTVGNAAILKPNSLGKSPIMAAVIYKQPRVLREYLDILKQNDLKVDKNALLQLAVEKTREEDKSLEIIALLVSEGANPAEKNTAGKSALDIAQASQKNKFVELMVKK